MARIIVPGGKDITDFATIRNRLATLGITLNRWAAPASPRTKELLDKQSLTDAEKEELLGAVEERFDQLKREKGYKTRDMVVIHEDVPGRAEMLAKFAKI